MASFIRFRLFGIVAVVILAFSGQAWSCSVCQGGQTETVQDAYIWITILLSLFPILAFGCFYIFWKRKQGCHENEADVIQTDELSQSNSLQSSSKLHSPDKKDL
jgi:hypothetical protein